MFCRNRRFLGMVQSTLQKFKDEEVRRQPQVYFLFISLLLCISSLAGPDYLQGQLPWA